MNMTSKTPEPVAIIGMGCRFPGGANSPEKLWEALCQGKDCFVDVPPDRWDIRKYYDPDPDKPGKISVKQGGFLKESIFDFDPEFFGLSPREAETLDPQQRLLLETTWEAIEDSGQSLPLLQSHRTGVFVGFFHLEQYGLIMDASSTYELNNHTPINSWGTMLSNKISYVFNLKGPSISVDTACSSSMTALEIASNNFQNGSCQVAIAGGVNCIYKPAGSISLTKGHFISERSRAFGIGATGYGRGEGVGMLVLKPLKQALRDGNRIHAVIRHAKLNQDGRTPGITLPNREAQAQLMEEVYQEAKVNSKDIRYFEAHGTGTDAGDKAEAWSINRVLSKGRSKKDPVYVGSIKTNIGHTEAAAGVAGLMKTALVLEHRKIPPSLHSSTLNPEISFKDMVLKIPQKLIPLPGPKNKPAFAAVNSFGYGGSNAHALLESPPEPNRRKAVRAKQHLPCYLVPFSARHPNALRDLAGRYTALLSSPKVSLEDFCHSLVHHRTHHPLRASVIAKSKAELAEQFKLFSKGLTSSSIVQGKALSSPPGVLFVYPGVGPQWYAMGRELWKTQPVYKKALLECDKHFQKVSGYSIVKELLKGKSMSKIHRTEILQPAITAVQIGLTELWKSWKVRPDMIVGHSLGEIAAAQAAGAISLQTAMHIVAHRARLLKRLSGKGGMLAVGLSLEQAQDLLVPYRSKVSVAANNDAESVTLSGDIESLQAIVRTLEKQSVFHRFLKVDVPYHSPATDEILPEFLKAMKNIKSNKPEIPLYSSLLGRQIKKDSLGADYWTRNIRRPVSFYKALTEISKQGVDVAIEIGPHPVLKTSIHKSFSQINEDFPILPSLIRESGKGGESRQILSTLGALFSLGREIHWEFVIPSGGQFMDLPTYPWQHRRLWRESEASREERMGSAEASPFLQKRVDQPEPTWEADVNENYFPFLNQHKIGGAIVFPGAGYLEGMIQFLKHLKADEPGIALENIRFESALIVPSSINPLMRLRYTPENSRLSIYSVDPRERKWNLNATASVVSASAPPNKFPLFSVETPLEISSSQAYSMIEAAGIQFGPLFRVSQKILIGKNEALAHIARNENDDKIFPHLFLLDGSFQASASSSIGKALVPRSIKSLHIFREFPDSLYVYVKTTWKSERDVIGDAYLWDEARNPVALLEEVRLTLFPLRKETGNLIYALNPSSIMESPTAKANGRPGANHPPLSGKDVVQAAESVLNSVSQSVKENKPFTMDLEKFTPGGSRLTPLAFSLQSLLLCLKNENPGLKANWIPQTGAQTNNFSSHAGYGMTLTEVENSSPLKEKSVATNTNPVTLIPGPHSSPGPIFRRQFSKPLRADEIRLKILWSALNFKDVLKAARSLSPLDTRFTYLGETLGMECAGVVEEAGSEVESVKAGDRVVGLAPNCLSSYLTFKPEFIVPQLKNISLGKNILYLPFVTAYYGLMRLAHLEKGERVLIHNATGGVGLAAVQVAQWAGARVIATAGSPEKRDYLFKLGIVDVYPSRTPDFHPEIKNKYGGVDVVIGAVQDELLAKSIDLLLTGGRYIELGKKNILNNAGLPMQAFDRNVSFFGVDLDRLAKEKPQIWRDHLQQIHKKLEQGIFKPLPVTVFPASKIKDAFNYMAQAKHIGRVLIDWQNQKVPVTPTLKHDVLKPNATYIVTGGLGGFGLEVSKWLVENGVKYVAPISRSGPKSSEAKEAVAWMKIQGAHVKALSVDVSDRNQVRRMMQSIKKDFPEVRGVVHCAGVLDDKLAVDIDRKSLEKVFAPKVGGALNLHETTMGIPLDFFVCFSSIVSIIGNVGQANYAAANGFLDGFAPYRRSLGLPCTTINWGAIGETGMVAKDKNVEKQLALSGIHTIPIKAALEALEKIMLSDLTNVGVFNIDWATWAETNPKAAKSPFFSEVLKNNINGLGQNGSTGNGFAGELREHVKKGGKAMDFSLGKLTFELTSLLRMQDGSVDPNQPLNNLGVDSLLGTELVTRIQKNLGLKISTFDIMRGITLKQLAEKATEQVSVEEPARN